jgi:hypothetical protein
MPGQPFDLLVARAHREQTSRNMDYLRLDGLDVWVRARR